MKPHDHYAERLDFGVEIETVVPVACLDIGPYHHGYAVRSAPRKGPEYGRLDAPTYRCQPWRAERDGSIEYPPARVPCEFVSPRMSGHEGVLNVCDFVSFAARIGAETNDSCGVHVTVSIESVLGAVMPASIANYVRVLARIAHQHRWALYAQTGKGRHLPNPNGVCYSAPLSPRAGYLSNELARSGGYDAQAALMLCSGMGRGAVSFLKALHGGVVEFRVFAGTLDPQLILHHLSCTFGLMRRAKETHVVPTFGRGRVRSGVEALERLWQYLGWDDSPGPPVAYGLCGPLRSSFEAHAKAALAAARQWDDSYSLPGK